MYGNYEGKSGKPAVAMGALRQSLQSEETEKEHRLQGNRATGLGGWQRHGLKSTLEGCRASTSPMLSALWVTRVGKQLGKMCRSLQCVLNSHGLEDH
jgi:hypothetical protein